MRRTWAKGNNEDFLTRTLKYAQRQKWPALLQAFRTAAAKVEPLACTTAGPALIAHPLHVAPVPHRSEGLRPPCALTPHETQLGGCVTHGPEESWARQLCSWCTGERSAEGECRKRHRARRQAEEGFRTSSQVG